jgi:hypothetical protein
MRPFDLIWRDVRIVGRAVWLNLALYLALVLGAALVLEGFGSYPEASFLELLVLSFHMTHLESVPAGQGVLTTVLIFGLPVLTIIILGEGALRVVAVYIRRRQRREVWDPLVAQTFSGHTIICGLGELGRAICSQILEKDPLDRLVLVDVRADLLAELGITESTYPNVTHIHGDMTSLATLEEANCRAAGLIIITSGEDGHNLEAGVKVQELNHQGKIWIRLHRSKVAQLISPRDNVHFFSPYQKAAETLLLQMNGQGE